MRVLFVEQELSYEPQGIMSMSAVLKQAGHEVALTVASLEDPVALRARLPARHPGLQRDDRLAARRYFELNRRIRDALDPPRSAAGKQPAFSVFGGPHPTFFPEMIDEPGVDGVCVGEGEGALLDLANALAQRNGALAARTSRTGGSRSTARSSRTRCAL